MHENYIAFVVAYRFAQSLQAGTVHVGARVAGIHKFSHHLPSPAGRILAHFRQLGGD